jgi:hypothetical protein
MGVVLGGGAATRKFKVEMPSSANVVFMLVRRVG